MGRKPAGLCAHKPAILGENPSKTIQEIPADRNFKSIEIAVVIAEQTDEQSYKRNAGRGLEIQYIMSYKVLLSSNKVYFENRFKFLLKCKKLDYLLS